MIAIGYILVLLGFVAAVVGEARFLVVAYRRGLWWFFGCVFIPIVYFIFFFLNLRATFKPIGFQVLGVILAAVGCHLAGLGWADVF
jgi:hypothetical protein